MRYFKIKLIVGFIASLLVIYAFADLAALGWDDNIITNSQDACHQDESDINWLLRKRYLSDLDRKHLLLALAENPIDFECLLTSTNSATVQARILDAFVNSEIAPSRSVINHMRSRICGDDGAVVSFAACESKYFHDDYVANINDYLIVANNKLKAELFALLGRFGDGNDIGVLIRELVSQESDAVKFRILSALYNIGVDNKDYQLTNLLVEEMSASDNQNILFGIIKILGENLDYLTAREVHRIVEGAPRFVIYAANSEFTKHGFDELVLSLEENALSLLTAENEIQPGDLVYRELFYNSILFGWVGHVGVVSEVGGSVLDEIKIIEMSEPDGPVGIEERTLDVFVGGDRNSFWGAYYLKAASNKNKRDKIVNAAKTQYFAGVKYNWNDGYKNPGISFRCDGFAEYCYEISLSHDTEGDNNGGIIVNDTWLNLRPVRQMNALVKKQINLNMDSLLPSAPELSRPNDKAEVIKTEMKLSWSSIKKTAGADSFTVYYGEKPPKFSLKGNGKVVVKNKSAFVRTGVGVSNSLKINVDLGKLYYWYVIAKNENGETSSDVWSFATRKGAKYNFNGKWVVQSEYTNMLLGEPAGKEYKSGSSVAEVDIVQDDDIINVWFWVGKNSTRPQGWLGNKYKIDGDKLACTYFVYTFDSKMIDWISNKLISEMDVSGEIDNSDQFAVHLKFRNDVDGVIMTRNSVYKRKK